MKTFIILVGVIVICVAMTTATAAPKWTSEGEVLNNVMGETLIAYRMDKGLKMTLVLGYEADGRRFIKSARIYKARGVLSPRERRQYALYLAGRSAKYVQGGLWRTATGSIQTTKTSVAYTRETK